MVCGSWRQDDKARVLGANNAILSLKIREYCVDDETEEEWNREGRGEGLEYHLGNRWEQQKGASMLTYCRGPECL